MNQKEITIALKSFSDKQLEKEMELRMKINRGSIIGYRVVLYGDEYDYGHSSDFFIRHSRPKTKKLLKKWVEDYLKRNNEYGGYIKDLYKDTPPQGKVH